MSSQKTVERLECGSLGSQAVYREMYTDGTRSAQTSVPGMSTDLAPEKFREMKKRIERAKIGQVVQIAPLRQRRW